MTFPISRQGLEQIALALAVGIVLFGGLALLRWRRKQEFRRFAISSGILAGLAVAALLLAYTVAPNIPTPPVSELSPPVIAFCTAFEITRITTRSNGVICPSSRLPATRSRMSTTRYTTTVRSRISYQGTLMSNRLTASPRARGPAGTG